ncbi:DUF4145 domain-containing protein [Sinorhizobium meliloti]|uniref:DUF4145 domain-containing protein n=1 Tax=Pararhizobium arenae TaxID=1856850 RepID=UPI00094AED68|nr:DUF4145 domain-containing protein [Pararhizobium arenae]MDW9709521.1 DUF4145 domain-containing protein [Sinorhizobium meliloti]MDW9721660.1 DUF4145 domain-containing protein [Sinorhizobium meliloti]MDW9728199.1 DUF4145 domain-containing protein [Sinorhizobium meliloti]MDW9746743.1 DUF4145 domain-containing protein [Sinorhizobium meliloti]
MNRDLWEVGFKTLPKWTCPHCQKGSLLTMHNFPRCEETEYSKDEQNKPDSEPDWTVERFVALMKCEVSTCGEIVVVGGDRQAWMLEDYEHRTQSWESILVCGFIRPAPHIIPVSGKLPHECAKQLKKAFELYWVDKAAAANRLRIFVERLMDHFKVPLKGKGKKTKIHTLDLSERIDEFDTMKPGHKDALDALRHVGNYGSHEGQADTQALLDCFELLEDALAELIDEKKAMLAAKAQKLIQNKGKNTW